MLPKERQYIPLLGQAVRTAMPCVLSVPGACGHCQVRPPPQISRPHPPWQPSCTSWSPALPSRPQFPRLKVGNPNLVCSLGFIDIVEARAHQGSFNVSKQPLLWLSRLISLVQDFFVLFEPYAPTGFPLPDDPTKLDRRTTECPHVPL
jgi:hypothetical protein